MGAFIAPFFASALWFSVFGGLAIKMERVAEIALGDKPDWLHGTIDCDAHYTSGPDVDVLGAAKIPSSPESKQLASIGYYLLACMPWTDQILDLVEPYMWAGFWHVLGLLTLLLWYITSSDSGSYADELLASSGLSHPPVIQKVYWCCTEGALASVLLSIGGNARKAVQGIAIVAGLPQTIALCLMCTSMVRVVKFEGEDPALLKSMKFNTQLFDFAEGYRPMAASPFPPMEHLKAHVMGLIFPYFGLYEACKDMMDDTSAKLTAAFATVCYELLWLFQLIQISEKGVFVVGWFFFYTFVIVLAAVRATMRDKYNIWGSMFEDVVVSFCMWPWVIGQLQLQARNGGAGARMYCADIIELKAKLAAKRGEVTNGGQPLLTNKAPPVVLADSGEGNSRMA